MTLPLCNDDGSLCKMHSSEVPPSLEKPLYLQWVVEREAWYHGPLTYTAGHWKVINRGDITPGMQVLRVTEGVFGRADRPIKHDAVPVQFVADKTESF